LIAQGNLEKAVKTLKDAEGILLFLFFFCKRIMGEWCSGSVFGLDLIRGYMCDSSQWGKSLKKHSEGVRFC